MDTHNNQDSNKNNHLDIQDDHEQRNVAAGTRQPQQQQDPQQMVTRSQSQTPPNSSTFHNLSWGLSSSGDKPRSRSGSKKSIDITRDTQSKTQPSNTNGKTYRLSPEQLEVMQQVCVAENQSLQHEVEEVAGYPQK